MLYYAFPPEIDIQQSRLYLLERNNNYRIYTVVIIPSSKCEKMRSTSESPSNSSCKLNYSSSLTWSFNRTSWFFLNYRIIIKTILYRWSTHFSFTQNILIFKLYICKSNTVITYTTTISLCNQKPLILEIKKHFIQVMCTAL